MSEGKLYKEVRDELHALKRALLVGGCTRALSPSTCRDHLDELEALANTYGLEVVGKESCRLDAIHPALYLGQGKVEELLTLSETLNIDLVIFDDEISPNQQRNLEHRFKRPVIDRTELILEIFSKHAHTKEAMLQIELAKSSYQLPRLRRLWTHLSRQSTGGKGFLKGEGERQIELDRRLVRRRITQLKQQITEVRHHREVQRRARLSSKVPTFALVGYTNVGKSTLLRALTQADVLVEDKLFATLDTKARRLVLPNRQEVLMIDTVGFIRKIPHALVAAFKSTLEEALYTDILIHLIDISHPLAEEQAESTYAVLKELQLSSKPVITLLNKVDRLKERGIIMRYKLKYPRVIPFSAQSGEGFDQLLSTMEEMLRGLRKTFFLRIPQRDYRVVSHLIERGNILRQRYEESDILMQVEIPSDLEGEIEEYIEDDHNFSDS